MDAHQHATGNDQHGSAHAGHDTSGVSWAMAAQATLHCLTGCAIGEVLGMVIGTSLGLHPGATVALAVALAFVFGYALTMRGVLRAGLPFRAALKVALAADTISIAVNPWTGSAANANVAAPIDAAVGGRPAAPAAAPPWSTSTC